MTSAAATLPLPAPVYGLLQPLRSADRRIYLLAASNPARRAHLAREFPDVTARARCRAEHELTVAGWLRPEGLNLAAVHIVAALLVEHGNTTAAIVDPASRLITIDITLLTSPGALAVIAILRASNRAQSMTALRNHIASPVRELDSLLYVMSDAGAVRFVRGLKSRHDYAIGSPFAALSGYLQSLRQAAESGVVA